MSKKEKIKSTLEIYLNFSRKEDIRNEVKKMMKGLTFEEEKEIIEMLKDPKYIIAAVKSKDLEIARILCANGSILPTFLLKIAIDNCDTNMLNFLLDTDIDINENICDGNNNYEPIAYLVLHYRDELYEVTKKMLKLGANPNAKVGDNNVPSVYRAAYYLDFELFEKLTKGKYNIICAIDGALNGNNVKLLKHILTDYYKLIPYILDQAIYRNVSMEIFDVILDNNMQKYLINAEISHLKTIKHRINNKKYSKMLKALKQAKRKAN